MNLSKSFAIALTGLLTLGGIDTISAEGITAEAVLGDYKSDPLFGEAAAQESIIIEVGSLKFVPSQINVPSNTNIRFVFTNSDIDAHLMVMAFDLDEVLADQPFIDDFLIHGSQEVKVPGGHSHGDSSADDASPMVKLADEHPAVYLKPGDTKEILVKFSDTQSVQLACALDNHHNQGMSGAIYPVSQSNILAK